MSAQNEADQAISMFNGNSFGDHDLKVSMTKPKEQHIATRPMMEP
jgi:hypothetical protein